MAKPKAESKRVEASADEPAEPETPPAPTPVMPEEGSDVLYNGGLGHDRKAKVTAVYGGHEVALLITDDEGQESDRRGVSYGDVPGTWHWPESDG